MPDAMTSRERFQCVYSHEEPDRIPMRDSPWSSTVARWRREGLPKDVGVGTFFGFDHVAGIGCNNSPRYPTRVVEETDEYVISTTTWGATLKNWKHAASVPEFIDFKIKSYNKAVPFFMGLVLGDFVVGCYWGIMSLIVGEPLYTTWF